ncbi:MAG: hypothetical protein R2778_06980 [Saprospiraceae bacterium]
MQSEHGIRPKQAGNLTISFELLEDDERLLKCVVTEDDAGVGFNKGREKTGCSNEFSKTSIKRYGNHHRTIEPVA